MLGGAPSSASHRRHEAMGTLQAVTSWEPRVANRHAVTHGYPQLAGLRSGLFRYETLTAVLEHRYNLMAYVHTSE